MVDVALRSDALVGDAVQSRATALRRARFGDTAFRWLTKFSAIGVLLLLSGVIIALIEGSMLALRAFGIGFLFDHSWNPVTDQFGAIAPIYGTVVTSFIAMLIAVPVGIMIAFFLTELCPMWLRRPIGIAIELLAGIPSIIYGIWGLFIFAPFLQRTLQPFLIGLFGEIPVAGKLFSWQKPPKTVYSDSLILTNSFITPTAMGIALLYPTELPDKCRKVMGTTEKMEDWEKKLEKCFTDQFEAVANYKMRSSQIRSRRY